MDFFQAQDFARRNTKWLVLMFLAAVLAIIGAVYLVIWLAVADLANTYPRDLHLWRPDLFWPVAGATALLVVGGSLYRIAQLAAGGGAAVAEALGGRLLSRSSDDLLERRLLNVVDEMAIASGVTVPAVYVMDHETEINAFAAGTDPNAAVVAVTRGCLEKLSRDELQGVVGHEFSHILNGDMRINIRLIGLLHGILLIALIGRTLLRGGSRRSSKNSGGAVLLGLGLLIVGYLGVFFGHLIKAAVSRQREYLADASAVQFTRNPHGIAGALKKIAGLDAAVLQHPRAEEASHMFFGQGIHAFFQLLATHPPIEERIARLDPAFKAYAVERGADTAPAGAMGFAASARLAVSPEQVRRSVGTVDAPHLAYAHQLLSELPDSLKAAVHDPHRVASVLYAMLVVQEADAEATLRAVPGAEHSVQQALQHLPWLRQAGRAVRLPLVELALPTLKELPPSQQRSILDTTMALIKHDGRLTLFEFTLGSLLRHGIEERRPAARGGRDLPAIKADTAVLLSLLAYAGHSDPERARIAFNEATGRGLLDGAWEMTPRSVLSFEVLERVLDHLATLNYRFKAKLIEACVAAIAADGIVTVTEAELLRAVGARLDCPVPPLLPGRLEPSST